MCDCTIFLALKNSRGIINPILSRNMRHHWTIFQETKNLGIAEILEYEVILWRKYFFLGLTDSWNFFKRIVRKFRFERKTFIHRKLDCLFNIPTITRALRCTLEDALFSKIISLWLFEYHWRFRHSSHRKCPRTATRPLSLHTCHFIISLPIFFSDILYRSFLISTCFELWELVKSCPWYFCASTKF